jgi:hypothetical protein
MPQFTQLETIKLWFKEHEGELQHFPWPAQSSNLNITEPLWSVLETRLRNRFPPPISLKQLENVLQEEWYKIPPETVRSCTEGKRLSNTISIKKCMQYMQCFHHFVQPLYLVTQLSYLAPKLLDHKQE